MFMFDVLVIFFLSTVFEHCTCECFSFICSFLLWFLNVSCFQNVLVQDSHLILVFDRFFIAVCSFQCDLKVYTLLQMCNYMFYILTLFLYSLLKFIPHKSHYLHNFVIYIFSSMIGELVFPQICQK